MPFRLSRSRCAAVAGSAVFLLCSAVAARAAEDAAATAPGAAVSAVPGKSATAPGWESFGAPLSKRKPMPVAKLLTEPQKYAGKNVVVEGAVSGVCQNRGCWMTMQHEGKEVRVRFKDYAFFVPKDCAGQTARIEGVLSIEKIPVEEARHYLEDAGRAEDAAKITEPQDGLTFMASGVLLQR